MNIPPVSPSPAIGGVTSVPASASAVSSGAAPSAAADASAPPHGGDGPVFSALKASLAAQGFGDGTGVDKAHYEKAMHAFTHAMFAAAHAEKSAERAAGAAPGTVDTAEALRKVAASVAAGNAPADLQTAFDALQKTQGAGAAGSATLASVMNGLASGLQGVDASRPGAVVDTSA